MPPFHGVLILVANILPKCALYFLQFAEAEGRGGGGCAVGRISKGSIFVRMEGGGGKAAISINLSRIGHN